MSALERRLRRSGFRLIAGTDEAGRGCLAGPVVAAAVILDDETSMVGVDDSKRLSPANRHTLFRAIASCARAVSIGVVEPHTIDRINILRASKLAMKIAVDHLSPRPEVLLVDAMHLDRIEVPQIPVIHGDRRSVAIAAASIMAKVYRDRLMEAYDVRYPRYDFGQNRGYATESHRAALDRHGPSPIHRISFAGSTERVLFE